jgi:hypothetical protein
MGLPEKPIQTEATARSASTRPPDMTHPEIQAEIKRQVDLALRGRLSRSRSREAGPQTADIQAASSSEQHKRARRGE